MPNNPRLPARNEALNVDKQQELPKADNAQDKHGPDALSLVGEQAGEPGVDFAVAGADPSTVKKVRVKTSGNFNLMDPFTRTHIDANSDGVEVVKSTFISDKLESGQLVEV